MSQVTIYLPDELKRQLRREARKAKKSLSAYIAELAGKRRPSAWPRGFEKLYGSWEGELGPLPDPPPEDVESL